MELIIRESSVWLLVTGMRSSGRLEESRETEWEVSISEGIEEVALLESETGVSSE